MYTGIQISTSFVIFRVHHIRESEHDNKNLNTINSIYLICVLLIWFIWLAFYPVLKKVLLIRQRPALWWEETDHCAGCWQTFPQIAREESCMRGTWAHKLLQWWEAPGSLIFVSCHSKEYFTSSDRHHIGWVASSRIVITWKNKIGHLFWFPIRAFIYFTIYESLPPSLGPTVKPS